VTNLYVLIFLFNSILMDSYNAVKDRQDCFFILVNLAVILNIWRLEIQ